MLVQPPECLKKPLLVQHTTLMGAGPANCPPRVLHALSQPVTGHLHAETGKLMDDIKEGIKYVFQTRNTLTLCVSTAGHGAIEAVICNLLEPGEVAVITYHGVWGERISEMASRYGVIVKQLTTELGDVFPLKQIEESLIQHKPALLFVVQGESSTGCCQPIEGIGDLCHRYNCLLVVDTVASLASVPFKMDEWNVDVAYTGSQKCLGAPPGITPISFNKRAEEKIFSRKSPVPSYYLDIKELGDYWNCFGRPSRIYHHTVCTTLLYGLREALAMISEEGIENSIQRHQMCANRLYQGIDRMGLQLFVQDPRIRLPTITTVKIPDSTNWRLVCEYAMKTNHFELAAGVGPTTGKVFRLGVMGYNATFDKVDYLLKMLQESLIYARSKTSKL